MDKTVKEKWVAALRSGEYKQGHGYLKSTSNNFCCLGVLCDIIDPWGWGDVLEFSKGFQFFSNNTRSTAFLPIDVGKRIGLDTKDAGRLMDMNDNGKPFSEIANYIEQNL